MRRTAWILFIAGVVATSACAGDAPRTVDLAAITELPSTPGEVVTFEDVVVHRTDRWELPTGAIRERPIPVNLHVVRTQPAGSFLVLLGRDPHSGCELAWLPDFAFDGRTGWFHDHCSGSTYSADGTRVFGPANRSMDRFDSSVQDGRLIVDIEKIFVDRQ